MSNKVATARRKLAGANLLVLAARLLQDPSNDLTSPLFCSKHQVKYYCGLVLKREWATCPVCDNEKRVASLKAEIARIEEASASYLRK